MLVDLYLNWLKRIVESEMNELLREGPVVQRWLHCSCPDCDIIVSTPMPHIEGSKGFGDEYLKNIRCEEHEKTHAGAHKYRPAKAKPVARPMPIDKSARRGPEERNCGGDSRTYMPDT